MGGVQYRAYAFQSPLFIAPETRGSDLVDAKVKLMDLLRLRIGYQVEIGIFTWDFYAGASWRNVAYTGPYYDETKVYNGTTTLYNGLVPSLGIRWGVAF